MCQAMMEYNQGNYNHSVELLYPLRYRIVDIGGSDAQVKYTEMGSCGKLKANKNNQTQTQLQLFMHSWKCCWALRFYFVLI